MKYALNCKHSQAATRIVATYAFFAAVWIYLSDNAMGLFVRDPAILVRIGVFKGFLFIIATSVLLYQLISRRIRKSGLMEEQLRKNERMLMQAEAIAHLGHWRIDLESSRITWSEELYRITGFDPETVRPTDDWFEKLVHPEDRECLLKFRETMRREGRGSFEFRIIRTDGNLCYVAGCGETEHDAGGNAIAMFGIIQDTTELRRKERELRDKNAELERFTYTVSHDLKSPLITIKTFLGFLENDLANTDTGRVEQDIALLNAAADKMGRRIDDLLELSRIGRLVNPPVRAPFRQIVEEAIEMVAGRIADRGVQVCISGEAVTLLGDRPRLVALWQNLADNAVKFMGDQPSPHIEIGLERSGEMTEFFVRDNGIGIDPAHGEKIFGLFEKLDPKSEGTGLGLSIVRRIVETYQGKIRVESDGIGQGTCFRFTLPGALADKSGEASP